MKPVLQSSTNSTGAEAMAMRVSGMGRKKESRRYSTRRHHACAFLPSRNRFSASGVFRMTAPHARRNSAEALMSDPRFTDPGNRDPIAGPTDPMLRDPIEAERTGGAMWGWIAGIAVLVLIAFVLVGGWGWGGRSGTNTAANAPASAPATTGTGGNNAAPPPPVQR